MHASEIMGVCASAALLLSTGACVLTERRAETSPGPRWDRLRGFNLLAMFNVGTQRAFDPEDFRLIAALGFNYVRLPLDYRCWIVDDDWRRIDESALTRIDDALAYARAHELHVTLNFHRAPGYTVAPPPETRELWSDAEALEVCALHWSVFARRYRHIPPEELSFNLLNEPANVDAVAHAAVITRLVAAVRREDPHRPIVVDGRDWGGRPCTELLPLNVVHATRGYAPSGLSHYRTSWVAGSDAWPLPAWPESRVPGTLYGPARARLHRPLELHGEFASGTRLIARVAVVSDSARLRVRVDGATLLERDFAPGDGAGEWTEVVFVDAWGVYQNLYDLDIPLELDAPAQSIALDNAEGDWLRLSRIELIPPGGGVPRVLSLTDHWGRAPGRVDVDLDAPASAFRSADDLDGDWLRREAAPWLALAERGAKIVVGEFGAYRHTPHDVVLRWMRDNLELWSEAGWGWALWNFSGPFGVFDSRRDDVDYETYEGRQLDRKMLELLQSY